MKLKNIFKLLYSTRLMSVVILTFAIAMAAATFIENDYGTPTAKAVIYNTKWFEILMLLLTINFIGNIFKYRLFRKEKWSVFLFHIAFIVTLLGAFVSRYYSYEGVMPIREGETSNTIYSNRTYITTRVDNNKVMKDYGQDDPVLFGRIGSNNYHLSDAFGQESKTPFSIELIDYVYKAKEYLEKDENGDTYLHIVESSTGSRNDIFLKSGEVTSIKNILFSFNKPVDGAFNFSSKNGENFMQPIFDGTYMEMQTRKFTSVRKDSLSPLQLKKLYTFGSLRFVIKEIAKGKVLQKTATKKEQAMYPYDALTFKISSGDKYKTVTVKGTGNALGSPEHVSLNGLNFNIAYGSKVIETPFSLKLRDFEMERYPGTNSPSSFASEVTVIEQDHSFDYRIFMNHVLDYKGYRFFQSSFDPDEKGTVLSVNHDYWGTLITYIGYVLMGIGMFFSLFWKGTRFTELNQKLKKLTHNKKNLALLLLSLGLSASAQNHPVSELTAEQLQKVSVSREHADKFAHLVIQDNKGRLKPINTYALESLRKIFKADEYKGLTAEQVLLSAQLNPTLWSREPIIHSRTERLGKGSKIVKDLGFKDSYAPIVNFFTERGAYYLENIANESLRKKKSDRTAEDTEIIDLDERTNIWYNILDGKLLHIYPKPNDPNNKWYAGIDKQVFVKQDTMVLKLHQLYLHSLTEAIKTNDYKKADDYLVMISSYQAKVGEAVMPPAKKIDLEIKYNRYNVFFKLLIFYFNVGLLLMILAFIDLFYPNKKWVINATRAVISIAILGLIAHTFGLAVRWYVSDHAPWSNSYEATIFIAWVIIIAGLLFTRNRTKFIIAGAVLFAGFLFGIAHGNLMNPEMTNLVPVLKSYWLMIHVAIITASYGFLGLGALLGSFVLLLFLIQTKENKHKLTDTIKELSYINEMTLTIGLYMLSVGTFLGGVWANESWGRYWSWDPKEVWALISMMVYIFILHMRLVPGLRGKFAFNFASMVSIVTLMMTYFGVNYYLAGMHSYGKGDPVPIPIWLYYFAAFVVVFSIASYVRYKKIAKK